MKLIDTNALIVLILGLINPDIVNKHERTSIYTREDFENLLTIIENLETLVVLPNVWTELDHLIHKGALREIKGSYKENYVIGLIQLLKITSEKYIESIKIESNLSSFYDLGLTDTLLLEFAKNCEMLITADSVLSDYAKAFGIQFYDIIEVRNCKFK
jgi:predicted nucleic acid-binding protein